jgi:GNAT superfamily N-acetyltransferase
MCGDKSEPYNGMMSLSFAYLTDGREAVPQIARWWFDEWGHFRPGDSLEALISRVHGLLDREGLPIPVVAIFEDRIAGVAVLKLHELFDLYPEKKFWLGDVFVAPEFRGQGIGSALAMKIVEIAQSRGIASLHLQTQSLDGGLYAKLGWEKIEQIHHQGYDALVMVKRLASQ